MRFTVITFFVLIATLALRPAQAQSLYTCGDGIVRDVRTVVELVEGPPVISTPDRWGEPLQHVEVPPPAPRLAYVVTVQLFDVKYTSEAFTDAPENFDPTRLSENEIISVCINRDRMILDRRDGTDFQARIIRTERIKRSKTTE
jgi:hypothetical protein